jgi:hypothetical protein
MKAFNVMDYSLLVGIHKAPEDRPFPEPLETSSSLSVASTIASSPTNLLPLPSPRSLSSSLSNLVLKSQFREYHGGFLSHPLAREVFFIGVIDCLTFYGKSKKIANFSKSLLWEGNQKHLSCLPSSPPAFSRFFP